MRIFRSLGALWFLLLLTPLIMAMGTDDGEGPTRIPDPASDYKVLLTDQTGARVELTKFSIDGMSFVMGGLGQGDAAVPFAKVKEVELTSQGDIMKAKVILTEGSPVELTVKPSLKATGKTAYGNYRIPLGEVSRIQVLGRVN